MATDPAWSYDFCIMCGKQTDEGLYCSHACHFEDNDPSQTQSTVPSTSKKVSTVILKPTSTTSSRNISPFGLPPAIDFPPPRKITTTSGSGTSSGNNSSSTRSTPSPQKIIHPEAAPAPSRNSLSNMFAGPLRVDIPNRAEVQNTWRVDVPIRNNQAPAAMLLLSVQKHRARCRLPDKSVQTQRPSWRGMTRLSITHGARVDISDACGRLERELAEHFQYCISTTFVWSYEQREIYVE